MNYCEDEVEEYTTSSSSLHISISSIPWEGSSQGDILFEVGDRKFPVFRTLIMWRSPLMAELIKCSHNSNRFIVRGIKPDIFEKLLNFINHGKVNRLAACADELIIAAEKVYYYLI